MKIYSCAFLLTFSTLPIVIPAKAEESDYAKTRYLIVIAPSGGAFTKIGPLYSFHRIPQDQQKNGATFFLPKLASNNIPEVRVKQLLAQVDEVLANGVHIERNTELRFIYADTLNGPPLPRVALQKRC